MIVEARWVWNLGQTSSLETQEELQLESKGRLLAECLLWGTLVFSCYNLQLIG